MNGNKMSIYTHTRNAIHDTYLKKLKFVGGDID